MRQPLPLNSAQIVFEDRPLLRLNINGDTVDYQLRPTQVLLLAKQALAVLVETEPKAE